MKRLALVTFLIVSGCRSYDGHRAYVRYDNDGKCYEYTEPFGPGRMLQWRPVNSTYCPGGTLFVLRGSV